MTQKKIVLREFEWFQVQTKVRQIIGEVLQPLQKKMILNSSAIVRLQEKAKEERSKVEYITKMVHNDPEIFEHGVFSTIENKIKNSNLHIQQLQNKIGILEQFINSKIAVLDRQLKESGDALEGMNDFKEYLKSQINNQNSQFTQTMRNLFSNFQKINQDITQLTISIDQLKQEDKEFNLKLEVSDSRITAATANIQSVLKGFGDVIKEIKLSDQLHRNDIFELQEESKRIRHFQKYTRQLEEHIRALSSEISNMEYKMEVVHPMFGLAQIFDYAHHILPPQLHNNISIYFYNRYRELAEEIISNEINRERVGQRKRSLLDLLKDIHKRSTKQVFKLKKEHILNQGIDFDGLSHDKREQFLHNLQLSENFGDLNWMGQQSVKKAEKDQNQFSVQVQRQKQSLLADLKAKIEVEMKDSKQYIMSMEQLLKKELEIMEQSIQKCISWYRNLEISSQLQQKYYKQHEISCNFSLNAVKASIVKLERSFNTTHHALTAYLEIQKQDESDRQEIALLGVRERHRDQVKEYQQVITQRKTRPLQLDNSCLSCSGNPNYYNQFFKMACLTYTSSPVKYNNSVYERFQLLNIIQQQLNEMVADLQEGESFPKKKEESDEKMKVCQSSQVIRVPSRDTRSASDSFMIRNISSSQEIHQKSKEKDTPRILGANELVEDLMEKNRSKLCSIRQEFGYRYSKSRRQANVRDRSEYMMNMSGAFKELRKQNKAFMK